MKTLFVRALPFATQSGSIEVPDNLPKEQYDEYVQQHFNDISFDEPDLDYCGIDIEIDE